MAQRAGGGAKHATVAADVDAPAPIAAADVLKELAARLLRAAEEARAHTRTCFHCIRMCGQS
jgi:hypothetical protein